MKPGKPPVDARSLLIGLAAGAGAMLAVNLIGRNPDNRITQRLVNRALDRKYAEAVEAGPIRLPPRHRYVIFSDHHKGARNDADDFRFCEETYLKALEYYHQRGFTLVILGDAEELLEEKIEDVLRCYDNVLRSEARFHPDRLVRVYGNHDIAWQTKMLVDRYMGPLYQGVQYREGLLFQYLDGEAVEGELFLVHGYQGTLESDLFAFAAAWVLPIYRDFQIKTGLGATMPSRDACLRSASDNRLYRWVSGKRKRILICGHTHRPVWSSKTHLEKLTAELYDLLRLDPAQRPPDYDRLLAEKRREVEDKRAKYPPCDDMVKTKPAYFNVGCCRYKDGDITGIELEDGTLRLVKWARAADCTEPVILEQNELREIFLNL